MRVQFLSRLFLSPFFELMKFVVNFRNFSSDEYKNHPGDHPSSFLMLSVYLVIHLIFEDFGSPSLPTPDLPRQWGSLEQDGRLSLDPLPKTDDGEASEKSSFWPREG